MILSVLLFFTVIFNFSLQTRAKRKQNRISGKLKPLRSFFGFQKLSKVYIDGDKNEGSTITGELSNPGMYEELSIAELIRLITFDPFCRDVINEQFSAYEERGQSLEHGSMSFFIFDGFETLLFEFLTIKDIVNFRSVNRTAFLAQLVSSRLAFYKKFGPHFTKGFECLCNHSLSTLYLNEIITDVTMLTQVPLRHIDDKQDLKIVLNQALHYYRQEDKYLCCRLMEAMLKGRIQFDCLPNFFISADYALHHACRLNLVCLGKSLFMNYLDDLKDIRLILIYRHSSVCLTNENFTLFKLIMLELIVNREPQWADLRFIFKMAVDLKRHRFAKLMLETFPYDRISNYNCLLSAVRLLDTQMIGMLLPYHFSRPISCIPYRIGI